MGCRPTRSTDANTPASQPTHPHLPKNKQAAPDVRHRAGGAALLPAHVAAPDHESRALHRLRLHLHGRVNNTQTQTKRGLALCGVWGGLTPAAGCGGLCRAGEGTDGCFCVCKGSCVTGSQSVDPPTPLTGALRGSGRQVFVCVWGVKGAFVGMMMCH